MLQHTKCCEDEIWLSPPPQDPSSSWFKLCSGFIWVSKPILRSQLCWHIINSCIQLCNLLIQILPGLLHSTEIPVNDHYPQDCMSILTDSLWISSKGLQSSRTSPPQVLRHLREIGLASFVVHLLPLSRYPLIWTWWSAQKMGHIEKAFFLSVAYPSKIEIIPSERNTQNTQHSRARSHFILFLFTCKHSCLFCASAKPGLTFFSLIYSGNCQIRLLAQEASAPHPTKFQLSWE